MDRPEFQIRYQRMHYYFGKMVKLNNIKEMLNHHFKNIKFQKKEKDQEK